MKNFIKIIILVILVGAVGAFVYWQYNKRKIIKESISDAIAKKTDSLYFIKYDSSAIDEINGNAAFYNVQLQSDSAQKKLLSSTDSLPNALYNIRINKIEASGIDVAGLLQQSNVAAKKILLVKPVIHIINTGADHPKPFTINDTLELYQKILGKFNSIKADTIQVIDGTLMITNKKDQPQTTLENINITLNKFLIDSSKNYQSIVSYFIKDVKVTVENIQLPPSKNDTRINIEKLEYDAIQKSLNVSSLKQYKVNEMQPLISLNNIHISELNTDAFIVQHQLKAGTINCDGGLVTIYKNKKVEKGGDNRDQAIYLSSDLIDQARIAGINLGSTKIIVIDNTEPGTKPFVLENAKFALLKPVNVNGGTTINNLINDADWELSADGFSFNTKKDMYKVVVGKFVVNSAAATAKVTQVLLKPLLTEQQFVKMVKKSEDQYNLTFNNINVSGVNIKKLLSKGELEIETLSLQPLIKIFNDKTLPSDSDNRIGKYPHQSFLKLNFPVYIKTIKINNGLVSYREKGEESALVGNVFFNNLNATLSNVTNIPGRIKVNNLMSLNATAKFLGEGSLSTRWTFPMNTSNGNFHIEGQLNKMNALTLNAITEPLALASVKQGNVDKVTFNLEGTNLKADADILFLYRDLKLDILKRKVLAKN